MYVAYAVKTLRPGNIHVAKTPYLQSFNVERGGVLSNLQKTVYSLVVYENPAWLT